MENAPVTEIVKPTQYDAGLRALHWGMALLIIALWFVGNIMEEMPKGDLRGSVYGIHKAFGVLALALVGVRMFWRALRPVPDLPASFVGHARLAAIWGHRVLYALMIGLPISGILMSQANGRPVSMFGLFDLPTLVGKSESLGEMFKGMHGLMAWATALFVVGHVAAALWHQFFLKDGILARMLPPALAAKLR